MEIMEGQNFLKDNQSRAEKLFTFLFFALLIGSVFFTYYRFVLKKNYIIESQADCDPTLEKCFIWTCDPSATIEDEKCTGDAETDTWYYKLARRNAANIPLCDPVADDTCTPLVCDAGEKDCTEILCNDQNKIEQEVDCSDPEQYLKDNPPEEEGEVNVDANGVDVDSTNETGVASDVGADVNALDTISTTTETSGVDMKDLVE